MSRSNPTANVTHPCTHWFEWNGETGSVVTYDKVAKKRVSLGSDFTFILLDQLALITGWHDPSSSGITSNEIRDSRTDTLTVKAFKGGQLCSGLYANIKDSVAALGGSFTTNLYIACKDAEGKMQIGSLKLAGAALNAWIEFSKANKAELDLKAVKIAGKVPGKKGSVSFNTPLFKIEDCSAATNLNAIELDKKLQEFLGDYLKRTAGATASINKLAESTQHDVPVDARQHPEDLPELPADLPSPPIEEDDVPF